MTKKVDDYIRSNRERVKMKKETDKSYQTKKKRKWANHNRMKNYNVLSLPRKIAENKTKKSKNTEKKSLASGKS